MKLTNLLPPSGKIDNTAPAIALDSRPRMDYDRTAIPTTYDLGHDHGPAVLDQWMAAVSAHVDPSGVRRILDLACGTGRFASSLASRFRATVIGLDPSFKMLEQAQVKCADDHRVRITAGCGESVPLRSSSVDLIFISMAFHHFEDPRIVAGECERVLRRGGHLVLRTITRDQIGNYPYVPYFPASRPLLERRLPSLDATCGAFTRTSLRRTFAGLVVQEIARSYGEYAEKLAAGADTTLAMLDATEFAAGLASMRAEHRARPSVSIVEPIDLIVFKKSLHDS